MANKLYRFEWVFSRDGNVSGLFIEDENKSTTVDKLSAELNQ